MKKILLILGFLFSLSFALTFPVDIRDCKIIAGKFVGVTSWFSTQRAYGLHKSIDLPVPVGTPALAPETGEILMGHEYPKYDSTLKIWRSGYGNWVMVKTYTLKKTLSGKTVKIYGDSYLIAHLNIPAGLENGQDVGEGNVIGYSGSTGIVNEKGIFKMAPHIHFEVRDSKGMKKNVTKKFGDLVKSYLGSTDVNAFVMLGGGSNNN
jgi:murein DD-endopeptidase MepM/ murein hydrolase activator NlpD